MIGGTDTLTYVRERCGQFRCGGCRAWTFQEVAGQSHCDACDEAAGRAGILPLVTVTGEHLAQAREALAAEPRSRSGLARALGWSESRARAVLLQLLHLRDVERVETLAGVEPCYRARPA